MRLNTWSGWKLQLGPLRLGKVQDQTVLPDHDPSRRGFRDCHTPSSRLPRSQPRCSPAGSRPRGPGRGWSCSCTPPSCSGTHPSVGCSVSRCSSPSCLGGQTCEDHDWVVQLLHTLLSDVESVTGLNCSGCGPQNHPVASSCPSPSLRSSSPPSAATSASSPSSSLTLSSLPMTSHCSFSSYAPFLPAEAMCPSGSGTRPLGTCRRAR